MNKKILVAVDSDYDYISPLYNKEYGHYLTNSKYILHTFGFSRESALLEKSNLKDFFSKIKYTISHNADISTFINRFSDLAFKGLVYFTNEINNENKNQLIESKFHECFNILDENIVTNDLKLDVDLLEKIKVKLSVFFININYSKEETIESENRLLSLGINPSNAYRFISGHTVYDLIVKIHKQLTDKLYELEQDKIKNDFKGKEIRHRLNQLKTLFSKQFSIEAFCHCYPINDLDEIHQKIRDKVASIA